MNSIRLPLVDDERVRQFIAAFDAEFEFMNRGERAFQHGELKLAGGEAEEWARIQREKMAIEWALIRDTPKTEADRRKERNRAKKDRRQRRG